MSDDVTRHYAVSLSSTTIETKPCPCGRELWPWQDACPKCGRGTKPPAKRSRQRSQLWGGS